MENFLGMTLLPDMIRNDNLIASATEHRWCRGGGSDDSHWSKRQIFEEGAATSYHDNAEVAESIGEKVGREVGHEKVSETELAGDMVKGMVEFAMLLAEFDGAIRRGEEMFSGRGDLEQCSTKGLSLKSLGLMLRP